MSVPMNANSAVAIAFNLSVKTVQALRAKGILTEEDWAPIIATLRDVAAKAGDQKAGMEAVLDELFP